MWCHVRSDNSLPSIREENHTRTTPIGQRSAEGGDSSDTCLDAEMLYAGGVGKEESGGRDGDAAGGLRTPPWKVEGYGQWGGIEDVAVLEQTL